MSNRIAVRPRRKRAVASRAALGIAGILLASAATLVSSRAGTGGAGQLSAPFTYQVLQPTGEAPFGLRFFTTPVKTDSRGDIITGTTNDPVKNVVGAEAAGERGGLQRTTQIMFGCDYFNGRPSPSVRIDPNDPHVSSGSMHWPNVPQPFRSQPAGVAFAPSGRKLFATLPGREGYPDWRVAIVDVASRTVDRWVDLRPSGVTRGLRPIGIEFAPINTAIFPRSYAIVLNEYANFATVVDPRTQQAVGWFETGFYAEDLVFNADGTRVWVTDRFEDQVRAFRVDPGPFFTPIATVATGRNPLDRANPRDLALSQDGRTLYVGNTLGHTVAVIDVTSDANALLANMPVGGLTTDVEVAGRWGFVCGQGTNNVLNQGETGHGLPTRNAAGQAIKNDGTPLGYEPVMSDATKATTFDDLGSEINVFDTQTNQFVYRYVDVDRDRSMAVVPGAIVDLGDHAAGQKIVQGSGPEQMFVRGDKLFVTFAHSDKVQTFRIAQNPADPSQILTPLDIEYTGGITPQGVAVVPNGALVAIANLQTEDVSFLRASPSGALTRDGFVTVGVTGSTPDPTSGGNGQNLFATAEEQGLRWLFSDSYSDDGHKSCGFCHWQSRQDGCQWNVGANAIGGVKVCPQNKDVSDNWPEWYEGLANDMTAYASTCNGELVVAERRTALFPQANLVDRLHARDEYVESRTEANSAAIGRPELHGSARKVGFYDMAFLQILWTQNETRRFPNPLAQFPDTTQAQRVAHGRALFTQKVSQGGAGCADCHHNGNTTSNGLIDDTFQDFNVHRPGVVAETTVDGNGPFLRPDNDYFFEEFAPPQDEGSRQNVSTRNTKHLRSFWDSVPRWLHHGDAHSLREILLAPDSPLLAANERGFNFRTVRTDQQRAVDTEFLGGPPIVLPTEVPITFGHSGGGLGGDGKGPIYVSLDSPFTTLADGTKQIDRLGTSNVAPIVVVQNGVRVINPVLAANHVQVIRDTHGKTSHLSATDIADLSLYLMSLQ